MRLTKIFLLFLFLLANSRLQAQTYCDINPQDLEVCGGGDPDDPNAPIDSGVGLLIGAAALYTIKKLRDRKGSTDETSGVL